MRASQVLRSLGWTKKKNKWINPTTNRASKSETTAINRIAKESGFKSWDDFKKESSGKQWKWFSKFASNAGTDITLGSEFAKSYAKARKSKFKRNEALYEMLRSTNNFPTVNDNYYGKQSKPISYPTNDYEPSEAFLKRRR